MEPTVSGYHKITYRWWNYSHHSWIAFE